VKKVELLFTQHKNSFSVVVKNMLDLEVAQIQQLQEFVTQRHGYFDFHTYSFSLQKRMNYAEFKKLLEAVNIDADIQERVIPNAAVSQQRVAFGKYKGMFYNELPDSYLLWLRHNYNGPQRALITKELKKRKL